MGFRKLSDRTSGRPVLYYSSARAFPAFSPQNITGLLAWFKSDAGIASGATNVETWVDQSNKANNLTQATATNRPALISNAINGLPAVRFNGNNFLNFFSGLSNQAFSVFVIIKPNNNTQVGTILGGSNGSFQYRFAGGKQNCNKTQILAMGSSNTNVPTTAFSLASVTYATPNLNFRLDKAPDGTLNTAQNFSVSVDSIGINKGGGNEFLLADLVEILIYDSVMSNENIQAIENYLRNRIGLA